jgi:hypothetical protein
VTEQLLSDITKFVIMYGKKVIMEYCAVYMGRQVGLLSQLYIDNNSLPFDVLTNTHLQ